MKRSLPFNPSPQYRKWLAYINDTPPLLSLLYDLGLLPEHCQTDKSRQLMLAVCFGYDAAIRETTGRWEPVKEQGK